MAGERMPPAGDTGAWGAAPRGTVLRLASKRAPPVALPGHGRRSDRDQEERPGDGTGTPLLGQGGRHERPSG